MQYKKDYNDTMIDVLMTKYGILREDIIAHMGYLRSHVKYFQLISGAILAISGYVLSKPNFIPNEYTWFLWLIAIASIPIIINYLIFDFFHALYCLHIIGERLAMIETKINEMVGQELLMWERKISPKFNYGYKPIANVINPGFPWTIYIGLVVILFSVVIPIIGIIFLWNNTFSKIGIGPKIFIILVALFTIVSFSYSLYIGRKLIHSSRGNVHNYFLGLVDISNNDVVNDA